jgi:hypothetical protein
MRKNVDRQFFPTALRQVRTDLSKRNAQIALLGVGFVLGLSGPFETDAVMTLLPRVAYWVFVVATTFAIGSLASAISHALLRGKPFWLNMVCSSLLIGTSVALYMTVVNMLIFDLLPTDGIEVMQQWGVIVLISAAVQIGLNLTQTKATPALPPLLDRIALPKRGALIALSAEDHYVKVTTVNGTDMTLIRLSDAMKEVGDTQGLQIHRSHWVALDQISDITRTNDRGTVTLSNGETRPISRSYMAAVREAGLFPKGRAHG